jgi:hypothetical protein
MLYHAHYLLILGGLFVCLLGAILFGISTGRRRRRKLGEAAELGTGAVDIPIGWFPILPQLPRSWR